MLITAVACLQSYVITHAYRPGGGGQCRTRRRHGDAAARQAASPPRRCRGAAGQTTAEYALVLVGAATLAVLLITWATKTDRIGKLFETVMDQIAGHAR